MHITDIAPILTALGFLLNAAVGLMAYMQSRRNGLAQAEIKDNVAIIEKATNSMKDALVKATGEAALAKGTAAGLEQGRSEQRP